jgi:hypothetical protein
MAPKPKPVVQKPKPVQQIFAKPKPSPRKFKPGTELSDIT